jgi:ABC-2 type transport system ATP-binding protein
MAATGHSVASVFEVDHVSKRYGDLVALRDMTFSVGTGELFGFVGSNGAGKTTTMRIALGVLAADAGEVRWGGRPVTLETRRRIGYMPEERGLYPRMKIGEQLEYLGRLHGMSKAGARAATTYWLDRLGLAQRCDDAVQKLSHGNQQRVQLAAAVLHEPEVLVLDEPFSGLDPVAVEALSKVLVAEARRGATVLFSSHQLDLVEDLCERAIVVDRGRVVLAGTIDDLTAGTDPVLEIDVPSDRDGAWTAALAEAPVDIMDIRNGRVRLTLHPGPGTAAERAQVVLDAARRTGPITHFAFERRSLAEVFLTTVGRRADEDSKYRDPRGDDGRG